MVKHLLAIVILASTLSACNTEQASVSMSGKDVLDEFVASGISLDGIVDETATTRSSAGPLPKSFKENWVFVDPSLGNGKGGQIFVCEEKQHCDAIFAYYDMLKGMAGPYLYRNPAGTVVAQLNSSHSPESAKRYQAVLADL